MRDETRGFAESVVCEMRNLRLAVVTFFKDGRWIKVSVSLLLPKIHNLMYYAKKEGRRDRSCSRPKA